MFGPGAAPIVVLSKSNIRLSLVLKFFDMILNIIEIRRQPLEY